MIWLKPGAYCQNFSILQLKLEAIKSQFINWNVALAHSLKLAHIYSGL